MHFPLRVGHGPRKKAMLCASVQFHPQHCAIYVRNVIVGVAVNQQGHDVHPR
ncbi:hypothetical protein [Acinetobacter baumannii]|uniref:hypothetical protein n=1 Tax=Acinetobacter baumannii TaxID=470 RepID=UPI00207B6858|nr:hypothetical protein [Acinetobacter baumannii]MDA3582427.1 hypothetical protein [Acinetobacter baumannii]MDA3604564.1 hypothetical protein [Acinetobacter baumannii]